MIKRVVVPTDGSEAMGSTIEIALGLAERASAEVELVAVVGLYGGESVAEELEAISGRHGGGPTVRVIRTLEDVDSAIVDDANEDGTLVCIASAGHAALAELIEGSISSTVIRRSSRPVLAIGPHSRMKPAGSVLAVALDGTTVSESMLAHAFSFADDLDLTVMLVQVGVTTKETIDAVTRGGGHESAYLVNVAHDLARKGLRAEWDVLHGDNVVDALVEFSKRDDVAAIAIATHALHPADRLRWGGVTMKLIHRVASPVLTWHCQVEAGSTVRRTVAVGPSPMSGRRVVVGVGAHTSPDVIRVAADEAASRDAQLEIVHAWEYPWHPDETSAGGSYIPAPPAGAHEIDLVTGRASTIALEAHPHLSVASTVKSMAYPKEALVDASVGADLLVIGRHDRSLVERMTSASISLYCARHATCPVRLVPEPLIRS